MQTEVDIRNSLFPKEQVPASTPIPREVGTILLGMMAFCRCCPSVAHWRNERLSTIFGPSPRKLSLIHGRRALPLAPSGLYNAEAVNMGTAEVY
jgi:hypothetical protein